MSDILTAIEAAAIEMHRLRQENESYRTMLACLKLHLGFNQMHGGAIAYYASPDPAQWDALVAFEKAGRVALANDGRVLLDMKQLTLALLLDTMRQPEIQP